jgi:hypothetical protein
MILDDNVGVGDDVTSDFGVSLPVSRVVRSRASRTAAMAVPVSGRKLRMKPS